MQKDLKVYVITDTHHYAISELGFSNSEDQKCMNESGAIIDAVFEKLIAQDDIDIILICGDLTNNGERPSHKEFIEKLYRLKNAGKRVFVVTATHDYGLRELKDGKVVGKDDGKASRSELRGLYFDFGFDESISDYKDGLSYVASLVPGYRLLAINDDCYGSDDYDDEHLAWILQQIDEAKSSGDYIFAITHHPVLPPSPAFPLFSGRDMRSYGNKAAILADAGLEFIFTGHAHMQNISSITTENSNTLWDINTGSLVGYPTPIRRVVFEKEKVSITTEKIDSIDWDLKGLTLDEYLIEHFDFMLNDVFHSMAYDLDRLGALGGGFGLSRELIHKLRIPIIMAGKTMQKLTIGKVARLLWISRKVDKSIKDILIKDLVIEIIRNIFTGNEHYSPDTPMYQAIMAAVTKVHPLIKLFAKGNEIVEELPWLVAHMIYDDTPDNEAVLLRK